MGAENPGPTQPRPSLRQGMSSMGTVPRNPGPKGGTGGLPAISCGPVFPGDSG